MVEPLIGTSEAAKILNRSEKTVLKMAKAGEIPGAPIGRRWAFRESLLEEWLRARLNCSRSVSPSLREK